MLGEILPCTRELGNTHNIFAVKVTKDGETVGHVLRRLARPARFSNGGVISCEVIDPNRRYSRDLAQGGLEIPCKFKFQGNQQLVDKAKKLLPYSKKLWR